MNSLDIFAIIGMVAEKYGANIGINLKEGKATILYQRQNEGSIIESEIQDSLPKSIGYSMRLHPSFLKLEFAIVGEQKDDSAVRPI